MKTNPRTVWLITTALTALAYMLFASPWHQPESYHLFADRRTLLGIPNFWNVVSNLPFAILGIIGLGRSGTIGTRILFFGLLLTAFGSGFYHMHPNDATLVWDRLPMTLIFMPLLATIIGEWIDPIWERRLLIPLLVFGIGSVIYWWATDDLNPYGVAKFGPLVVLLPAMFTDKRVRGLWPVLVWFGIATLAETFDAEIYHVLPLSGHTLKHVAAAAATYWILRWSSTFSATPPPKPTPRPVATSTAG